VIDAEFLQRQPYILSQRTLWMLVCVITFLKYISDSKSLGNLKLMSCCGLLSYSATCDVKCASAVENWFGILGKRQIWFTCDQGPISKLLKRFGGSLTVAGPTFSYPFCSVNCPALFVAASIGS